MTDDPCRGGEPTKTVGHVDYARPSLAARMERESRLVFLETELGKARAENAELRARNERFRAERDEAGPAAYRNAAASLRINIAQAEREGAATPERVRLVANRLDRLAEGLTFVTPLAPEPAEETR